MATYIADMIFTFFEQLHKQHAHYDADGEIMPGAHWQAWEKTIENLLKLPFVLSYWEDNAVLRYAVTFQIFMRNRIQAARKQSMHAKASG